MRYDFRQVIKYSFPGHTKLYGVLWGEKMTANQFLQIPLLLVLLALSAFFSGAETALMSLNRIRLKHLVDSHVPRADIIYGFLDNPGRLLSTLLIGNNVVNIVISSVATLLFISLLGPAYGTPVAVVVATVLVLIFCEVTPKTLASQKREAWALRVARPISLLMTILSPLIAVLTWITNGITRLVGVTPRRDNLVTQDEIRTVIHMGQSEGVIELSERKMLTSVLEFNDTLVREIMIPRIDIFALAQNLTVEAAAQETIVQHYSRIPIYAGTVDNIIGLVHVKDLLAAMLDKPDTLIQEIMRPMLFVPETRQIGLLLEQMQKQRVSVAIVLDEFGSTSGMATIEDIVEEIVGEIEDEYDEGDLPMETLGESETLLDGGCSISDVNDQLFLNLPEELAATVGGYIFYRLGHIPRVGDTVTHQHWALAVEEMEGRRVAKVRVRKKA